VVTLAPLSAVLLGGKLSHGACSSIDVSHRTCRDGGDTRYETFLQRLTSGSSLPAIVDATSLYLLND
jgi:hypothetical protein